MKKNILKVLIASLCLSAIIGIIIIITGNFEKIETKILLTTLSIFMFCIPSLCSSTIYEKNKILSISGITTSILACLIFILLIYISSIRDIWALWQIFITLSLISSSIAHISLLLFADTNKITKIIRNCTITLSIIIDLIFILIIWFDLEISFKINLVLIILITLGTVIFPILNKIYKKNS